MTKELWSVRNVFRLHLYGGRKNDAGNVSVLTAGRMEPGPSPIAGIFEIRGRLTSELIDPLVESYRVLRCRALEVCNVMRQSQQYQSGNVEVRILGCAPETYTRMDECYLATPATPSSSASSNNPGTTGEAAALTEQCGVMATGMLAEERAALFLAVGYDSGYRSLLQVSGMMDWMLEAFSTESIRGLRDMVNMLGKLHQIPCFIGQCDSPKPPAVNP